VVDPQHDIAPYLEVADQKGMKITHIFETHIQADHLSGARRLAELTGATVALHELADLRFPHYGLKDWEEIEVGNVRVTVLHTPGHTPEGICLLVSDLTRGPEPWFVLTGDTLFSGAVGRPDLLGEEAGRDLAGQLYESLHRRLLTLPDYVEVYPAHFGGAACGKGLSGKAASTIGFERRWNPALRLGAKDEFVRFTLAELPAQPESFAANRRVNQGIE